MRSTILGLVAVTATGLLAPAQGAPSKQAFAANPTLRLRKLEELRTRRAGRC